METSIRKGLPRAMVDDVFFAPVHINAGGTVYTTTLNTLTKYPESKLAKLFDGTLAISIDPMSRQYFLDVNGSIFIHILDFMRYGELLLPDDFTQLPLLTRLAEFFEIQELLDLLNSKEWHQNVTIQKESGEDNRVEAKGQRRRCKKSNSHEEHQQNERNHHQNIPAYRDVAKKNVVRDSVQSQGGEGSAEIGSMKVKSMDIEAIKSETSEFEKVEAKTVEADTIKTHTFEVESLKSEMSEMASIQAVNVDMTSVEAGGVKAQFFEVGTFMAMALEVGTLMVRTLETESIPGNVKVAMVRYDEYYKIIDVYSPDELTILNPMFPHQPVRSEYIANCNRLCFKFGELPCVNPTTSNKFGVPYLLYFFQQLLNKGYRFSSVVTASELNYTRDYVLVRLPSPDTRP